MSLVFAKISTLCAWLIFWLFILIVKIANQKKDKPKFIGDSGWGSTATIVIFFTLLYSFMWMDETSVKNNVSESWFITMTIFGFITLVTGLALAVWSIWHLGRSWSATTASPENLPLRCDGPFSLVRHPIYLSQALLWLGSVIMFLNPVGFVLGILILIPTLRLRIETEEENLLIVYGDAYRAYRLKVGNFFPKIR